MRIGACIGFSALAALIAAVNFGQEAALTVAVVCCVMFACTLAIGKIIRRIEISPAKKENVRTKIKTVCICSFSAFIALLSFWAVQSFYVQPIIEKFADRTLEFSGQVVSSPISENGTTSFTVKADKIDGECVTANITVHTNLVQPLDCYDHVTVSGDIYSNYSVGFGYQSYCGARGIFLEAYVNQYYDGWYSVERCSKKPWYSVFTSVRESASKCLEKYLSFDLAAVCTSIITGEKSNLPDEIYDKFKVLGTAHMLVVSGLHLSIVAGILFGFTCKFIKNKRLSAFVQIIGVLSFAAVTGFGFSVVRSSVMIIIMILARSSGSKTDALNSLGISAAVLCLNPLNVGDMGLLWSVSSTLSIILFSGKINSYFNERLRFKHTISKGIVSVIAVSSAAMVGSLPFLIFVTGNVSPYTLIVNLLIVPFTGIIIVCGGCAIFLFSVGLNFLGYPLILICGVVSRYVLFVTDAFCNLPFSGISTEQMYTRVWFVFCVAVAAAIYLFDKRRKYLRIAVLSAIVLLCLMFCADFMIDDSEAVLSVLDVGDGLTVILQSSEGSVMINSYGEKYKYSYINSVISNSGIDCIIDTEPSDVLYCYCTTVADRFDVGSIFVYDKEKAEYDYCYQQYRGAELVQMSDDYILNLSDDINIRIFTENGQSWQYVTAYGKTVLICPPNGNAEDLPSEMLCANIVAANGLPYNIERLDSEIIVISSSPESCIEQTKTAENLGAAVTVTGGLGDLNFILSKDGIAVDR